MKIQSYLTFDGTCKQAFEFYAKALGAKIEMMMTHGESPMAEQTPKDWRDKIMHASLTVGDQSLMGSDRPPGDKEPVGGFSVSLSVDKPAEAERLFKALSQGGTVRMEMQETFWAQRFGMLTDRFGVPWMVNCERPH
jgi:PhnB protein